MFFWVSPRRQIVVCRRFGTLCQFHLQRLDVEYEVWIMRGTHGIYTRAGVFTRAGGPIGDQAVGGSEWVGRSRGRGIKRCVSGCGRVIVYSCLKSRMPE